MKHILFLTWKDLKHPRAGGAERVIFEYAQRLVRDGQKVTWFASHFSGASQKETLEGIEIVRKYSLHSIYFFAYFWYKNFIKTQTVDIIIDEAGGIPLLSPLYEKNIPLYFFIHHIGEHEYDTVFPFPLNRLFKAFVFWTFSLYKKLPTLTVSDSTAQELREKFGFKNISVLENASNLRPIEKIDWKSKKKEVVFLGRLTAMKRVEEAIQAFSSLSKKDSEYTLNIIGSVQDTEYYEKLIALVTELDLSEKVFFRSYSEETLKTYLSVAQVMLVTSTKEGYGLVVLEGNCFGLPVLAYDVPGLRDSVKAGINGELIPDADTELLGKKLIELVQDEEKRMKISESSLQYIKDFGNWDTRYQEFKKIIKL